MGDKDFENFLHKNNINPEDDPNEKKDTYKNSIEEIFLIILKEKSLSCITMLGTSMSIYEKMGEGPLKKDFEIFIHNLMGNSLEVIKQYDQLLSDDYDEEEEEEEEEGPKE